MGASVHRLPTLRLCPTELLSPGRPYIVRMGSEAYVSDTRSCSPGQTPSFLEVSGIAETVVRNAGECRFLGDPDPTRNRIDPCVSCLLLTNILIDYACDCVCGRLFD